MIGELPLVVTLRVGTLITVRVMLRSDHPLRVAIAGAVLTLFALRIVLVAASSCWCCLSPLRCTADTALRADPIANPLRGNR
jgi:hypothetical protein